MVSEFEFRKYPTTRDKPPKSVDSWLEGKRLDDGSEPNLWRVGDKLYDLSSWIHKHPGGKMWIESTRGTDITEAFESHHPDGPAAEAILNKYYVKAATEPRNSPFTFEENGFYRTLKRKAWPVLKQINPTKPTLQMNLFIDFLFAGFIASWFFAMLWSSYFLAGISGIFLCFVAIAAHNYFHKKDNFRMYYFDLTMVSSYDWRISHAMSHHLYTNTVQDIEISGLEPILQFLPRPKSFMARYAAWIYSHFFYVFALPLQYLKRHVLTFQGKQQKRLENYLPILELIVGIILCGSVKQGFFLWAFLHLVCSYWFAFVGLIAAHHHPDIWHEGDELRYKSNDWGIRQIEAVRDRKDITGNLLLVATTFGDHTLHHLFPTVDHSKLPLLYPVFLQTCEEFGVEFKFYTILSLMLGKYKQMARVTTTKAK